MYISVIPALNMPFGHGFFDYKIESSNIHKGDLIFVPFRNRWLPALVASLSAASEYADRAIQLSEVRKLQKFPESLPDFLIQAAQDSFVSPTTMLHSWLRQIPKRLDLSTTHLPPRQTHSPKNSTPIEEYYVTNRYFDQKHGVINLAATEQSNGRVLILTPWQRRADFLAARLGCNSLHAHTPMAKAWQSWNNFLSDSHGLLVSTRLGAWLSAIADVVIIDEPENDDHKQDELTPRYDARIMALLAQEYNPSLRIIKIGTTPPLSSTAVPPDLEPDIIISQLDRQNRSEFEGLTLDSAAEIQDAVAKALPIRILHPVLGFRGRLRCADCGWTMACTSCGAGVNNLGHAAYCKNCKATYPLPLDCPSCHGTNLNKSFIGGAAMQDNLKKAFPEADVKVLDLHEWLNQSTPPKSLVIMTDLSMLGGATEDIRRRERLIISFRRLVAQSCVAKYKLVIQCKAELIAQARSWLTASGLAESWHTELLERKAFEYPPAIKLIKLISPGPPENLDNLVNLLESTFVPAAFKYRGPFSIENLSDSRAKRSVTHLIPPQNLELGNLKEILTPLTAYGIIDLDPVAFFC